MASQTVNDIEYHSHQNDSHAHGDRHDKYRIQVSYKGRFVIAVFGRSHSGLMIFSKPNTLPKRKPNMVEKKPQQEMMAARFIFFARYNR